MLELTVRAGETISSAAEKAARLLSHINPEVTFEFNGTHVIARLGMSPDDICDSFYTKRVADQTAHFNSEESIVRRWKEAQFAVRGAHKDLEEKFLPQITSALNSNSKELAYSILKRIPSESGLYVLGLDMIQRHT